MAILKKLFLFACVLTAVSCGGSSSDSVVITGSLIQGSNTHHSSRINITQVAHGAGEPIENISICALGACTITDLEGKWGFSVDSVPNQAEFSIVGHGINQKIVVDLPTDASTIEISFVRNEEVEVQSIKADEEIIEDSHNEE